MNILLNPLRQLVVFRQLIGNFLIPNFYPYPKVLHEVMKEQLFSVLNIKDVSHGGKLIFYLIQI